MYVDEPVVSPSPAEMGPSALLLVVVWIVVALVVATIIDQVAAKSDGEMS